MDVTKLAKYITTDWKYLLTELAEKYGDIINTGLTRDADKCILPPCNLIFSAFDQFDTKDLKVVILSQDPYIHKREAMGLCFSVPPEMMKLPPSLRNIFKELEYEYGIRRTVGDLTDWAKQGVLLLNTALTTVEGCSGHHMHIWKTFTHDVLEHICNNCRGVVFMLWGAHAQSFEHMIDIEKNMVLKHSHPSPLSRRSFVGNGHFKLCNSYLERTAREPIKWV